jgi:uncharacterized protein DUF4838/glycosyl hydrolase family 67
VYIKKLFIKLALLFLLISVNLAPLHAKDIVLAQSGNALGQIVVDVAKTSDVEKTAAQELKKYLEQMSGAKFLIVSPEKANSKGVRIFIGRSDKISQLLPKIDFEQLKDDTIIIKSVNSKEIVLSGARPRGTLFAVYTLLEDVLNCNFWTPSEFDIPHIDKLVLPDNLNTVYTPSITNRSLWFKYLHPLKGPFGAMLKLNGGLPRTAKIYGGYKKNLKGGHSFHYFLPPKKYFKINPEWYGEIKGKRVALLPTGHKNQMCLSNKKMLKEFIRQAKIKLNENPNVDAISVSQEDGTAPCSCSECKKLDVKFGGQVGTLLNFVNQVAVALEKSHPNIKIETYAYQWSVRPPKKAFKCHRNVLVRICSINEDFSTPWHHKRNKNFDKLIKGWRRVAKNIAIYDYAVNYHMYLINSPYWDSMAKNIRYYVKNNVTSVLYEGDNCNYDGSFNQLRGFLLAHLLWNPKLDFDKLLDHFLNGYYGKAGSYLKKYLKLSSKAARRNTVNVPLWSDDPAFLSVKEILKAKSLFDSAEAAVINDKVKSDRLKLARLGFDLQLLLSCNIMSELRKHISQKERDKLAVKFIKKALSSNNTFYTYQSPVKSQDFDYLTGRKQRTLTMNKFKEKTAKLPKTVKNEYIKSKNWSDIQETQFRISSKACKIISDKTASNAVAINVPSNAGGWAISAVPFSKDCRLGKVDLYISAKINATASNKVAFTVKVYNNHTSKYDFIRVVRINEFKNDGYNEIKLGRFSPCETHLFTFTPVNSSMLKDITVDRFFVTKRN